MKTHTLNNAAPTRRKRFAALQWLALFGYIVTEGHARLGMGATEALQRSTRAALPAAGRLGRVRVVTDSVRGIFIDNGEAWNQVGGEIINVCDGADGARGDANPTTGGIVNGQHRVTITTTDFTELDVGKTIILDSAGAAGAPLVSTISAYVSPTQVDIVAAASTTMVGGQVVYGTDDTAALLAAIATNRSLFFPGGKKFIHTATLLRTQAGQCFIGAGGPSNVGTTLYWAGAAGGCQLNMPQSESTRTIGIRFDGRGLAATAIWLCGDSSDGLEYTAGCTNTLIQNVWFIKHTGKVYRVGDGTTTANQADGSKNYMTANGLMLDGVYVQAKAGASCFYINEKNSDGIYFNNITTGTDVGGALAYQFRVKQGHVKVSNLITTSGPAADWGVYCDGGSMTIDQWDSEDPLPFRSIAGTRPGSLRNVCFNAVNQPGAGSRGVVIDTNLAQSGFNFENVTIRQKPGAAFDADIEVNGSSVIATNVRWKSGSAGTWRLDGAASRVVRMEDGNVTVMRGDTAPSLTLTGPGGDEDANLNAGVARLSGAASSVLLRNAAGTLEAQWTWGSGSPEGVVTAPVGSIYSRTNGGAGTSLYVKESGAGNTGWVPK